MLLLHLLSVFDNLQVQVWVLAASAQGAQCAHHTDVESRVAELGSCDVQGAVLGGCIQSHCVPSTRDLAVIISHDYQESKTSPRALLIPFQVVKGAHCIVALKCAVLSLLDDLGWGLLFHLVFATHPCSENKMRFKKQIVHSQCFLICIPSLSP